MRSSTHLVFVMVCNVPVVGLWQSMCLMVTVLMQDLESEPQVSPGQLVKPQGKSLLPLIIWSIVYNESQSGMQSMEGLAIFTGSPVFMLSLALFCFI